VCSFAVNRERLPWSRLLVWLAYFVLSLTNYRLIPFFAVVAAPITAVNFLDFAARLATGKRSEPAWRSAPFAIRDGVLAAGLLLLVETVPGWLQTSPADRRVGLGVRIDPSLQQAALQLRNWREQGMIGPEERLFTTTPEVACYLAWFCPEMHGFLDLRLPLFTGAAHDFVDARATLTQPAGARQSEVWRSVFSKWNIRYLVAHLRDPRNQGSLVLAHRLHRNPDGRANEWTVCYLDGRTMIARWNGAAKGGAPEVNAEQLAYGPETVAVPSTPPASARGWWSGWTNGPTRPLAADEAFMHFFRYDLLKEHWEERSRRAWQAGLASSIAGTLAVEGGPLVNGTLLTLHLALAGGSPHDASKSPPGSLGGVGGTPPHATMETFAAVLLKRYQATQRSTSVASLYLALRAARRALAEEPDAATYYLLAQVYFQLAWLTDEQNPEQPFPHLSLLRQAQAMASLQAALQLDPDHEDAHALLAEWARRGMFLPPGGPKSPGELLHRSNLELELKHRKEALRCARRRVPVQVLARMEQQVKSLERRVNALRDQLEVAAQGTPGRIRAEMALDRGLVETALQTLVNSPEDPKGRRRLFPLTDEARVLELLLATGRVEEAIDRLHPEDLVPLGMLPAPLALRGAEWFHFLAATAVGNSEEADRSLAVLLRPSRDHRANPSGLIAATVGHQLLWEAPLAAGMPWQIQRKMYWVFGERRAILHEVVQQASALLQAETDLAALRGCVALEAGLPGQALGHFQRVLLRCQVRQDGGGKGRAGPIFVVRGLPLSARHAALLEANGTQPDRPGSDE
jgi:tetratricopeptide (TPR) repeat protein